MPDRKKLPHEVPSWVPVGATYFITICALPRGINSLAIPAIAPWLLESLSFRESRGDWYINLAMVMPDHVHLLMSFAREIRMAKSIGQWKRYVSREKGVRWQRDFFEHRLRDDENQIEKANYVRMNPVRAGLVKRMEDWPYVLSMGR